MALVIGNLRLGNLWKLQTEVFNLVISHYNRYPEMEIEDVYKLLYQGAVGPEHAINSPEIFENSLAREMEEMDAGNKSIPLWENIRPDGELVRTNLAPYKVRGGNAEALSTLCLWTASSFKGQKGDLREAWHTFQKICSDNRIRKFTLENFAILNEFLEKSDFPPVHHSKSYRNAYRPAYRLVRREFLSVLTLAEK